LLSFLERLPVLPAGFTGGDGGGLGLVVEHHGPSALVAAEVTMLEVACLVALPEVLRAPAISADELGYDGGADGHSVEEEGEGRRRRRKKKEGVQGCQAGGVFIV